MDMSALRSEISALIVEFAWRIDHNEGRLVEDLFTDDAGEGRGCHHRLPGPVRRPHPEAVLCIDIQPAL